MGVLATASSTKPAICPRVDSVMTGFIEPCDRIADQISPHLVSEVSRHVAKGMSREGREDGEGERRDGPLRLSSSQASNFFHFSSLPSRPSREPKFMV